MVVAKLKGARDRQRALNGKCEGRKSHAEMHPETQRVDLQDTWRRAYNPVRAQSHYRGADRRGSFRVLLLGHPQG